MKDYPQLSVRLPGEVKTTLHALTLVTLRPQWRIITDAIDCYLRQRSDSERRMIEELVGRLRRRARRPRHR